jgi:hypothetical protein
MLIDVVLDLDGVKSCRRAAASADKRLRVMQAAPRTARLRTCLMAFVM